MTKPKPTKKGVQRIIDNLKGALDKLQTMGFAEELQKEYRDEIEYLTKLRNELPE